MQCAIPTKTYGYQPCNRWCLFCCVWTAKSRDLRYKKYSAVAPSGEYTYVTAEMTSVTLTYILRYIRGCQPPPPTKALSFADLYTYIQEASDTFNNIPDFC